MLLQIGVWIEHQVRRWGSLLNLVEFVSNTLSLQADQLQLFVQISYHLTGSVPDDIHGSPKCFHVLRLHPCADIWETVVRGIHPKGLRHRKGHAFCFHFLGVGILCAFLLHPFLVVKHSVRRFMDRSFYRLCFTHAFLDGDALFHVVVIPVCLTGYRLESDGNRRDAPKRFHHVSKVSDTSLQCIHFQFRKLFSFGL